MKNFNKLFLCRLVMVSRNQRGFSLVELMVGVVIGLIGVFVIMQAFVFNEAFKRSTTGTGQAQANGAIALYTIERDVRMAGYGLNHPDALACGSLLWYYNGSYSSPPAAAGTLPPLVLAPVVIVDGGAGGNDSITVMYGGSGDRVVPGTAVTGGAPPPSASEVGVDSIFGFLANDLIVVSLGPGQCVLYNITNTQITGSGGRLQKNPGAGGPFNPPGNGLFPGYAANNPVFNLGQLTAYRYAIGGNDLQFTPVLTPSVAGPSAFSNVSQIAVNDIVAMKAWYGKDVNPAVPDGQVDTWDKVQPATAVEWQRLNSVRIAVLARSGNFEKPKVAGDPCEATLAGGRSLEFFNPVTNLTDYFTNIPDGLPSCFKYRTFEVTVPLRNMLWRLR